MRWLALLVACAGCGRIGFDPAAATDGPAIDLPPPDPSFVLSVTQLASPVGFSFVTLAVDWPRSLAYVGTRESGHCVAVIDFSNEQAPAIIQRIDPGDSVCLSVELLDDTHLAVLTESGNRISVWSLGADPHTGGYAMVSQLGIAGPRHFQLDRTGPTTRLLVATGGNPAIVDVAVDPSYQLTVTGMWTGTCALAYEAVAAFGVFVAVGCQADHAPVEVLSRAGLATAGNPIPDDATTTSGFWNAVTSPDGGRAFVLGWVNAALSASGSSYFVDGKWRRPDGHTYRAGVMLDATQIWTAVGDGSVELLSATDLGHIVGLGSLGAMGEAYDLDLDLGRKRGIVVTNHGSFVVIDPTRIPAADFTWPAN